MDMEIPDGIYILASEPLPNITVEQLKNELQKCHDEQSLARIYAGVFNKVGYLMHFLDDDNIAPEIEENFKAWAALETSLKSDIFSILEKEPDWLDYRSNLKNSGYYWQLMPFMERNGFSGRGGWWVANG